MTTIITREVGPTAKGSLLTNSEMDNNLINLNTQVTPRRPSIRPSLLLDFANTKQLDPRITFSRPTTATYYDGKTVAKAEENLLLQSQALATSSWSQFRLLRTNNADTAPDGTTTATSLTQQTSETVGGILSQVVSPPGNTTYSVFIKPNGKSWAIIRTRFSPLEQTWFNVANGVVGTTSAVHTATITAVGNGWYRCIVTSSNPGSAFTIQLADTDNSTTVTDSGGILAWGAQLEQRSTVTAYTPTTTAPITNYIPALQTAVSNDARFDHDPVTGESKGLLIEEQRTNLFTYSGDIDNAAWPKSRSGTTPNVVIAPDGTLSGDKWWHSTTAGSAYIYRSSFTTAAGTNYCVSGYFKAAEVTQVSLQLTTTNGFSYDGQFTFDLLAGSYIGSPIAGYITTVTNCGNGWYRLSLSATCSTTATANFVFTSLVTSLYDNFSGVYVWGLQCEAGSFPTSYIPTVASQVTRSADSASMTGSNFSSWYRQDEGTVYSESLVNYVASNNYPPVIELSDGTNPNKLLHGYGPTPNLNNACISAYASYNGVEQVGLYPNVARGTPLKLASAFKSNDFAGTVNGAAVGTDTSGVLIVANQAYIGRATTATANTGYLNGTIKRIAYYPKRLSNSELQGLTS